MIKFNIFDVLFVLLVVIVLILSGIGLHSIVYAIPLPNNSVMYIETCRNYTYSLETILDPILKNVSNHVYQKNVYDCKDFSQTLVNELKKINISAYCIYGFYSCSPRALHEWVAFDIGNFTYHLEATKGYFIDDETYSKCYKELKVGWCGR